MAPSVGLWFVHSRTNPGEYALSPDTMSSAMHFAEPRWLWLALFGPLLLAGLQVYSWLARKRQLAEIASPGFIHQLTQSHSPLRRAIKNLLLVLTLATIGLALARPQWGEQRIKEQHLGEDVVFILDC